jgi:CHRD domain
MKALRTLLATTFLAACAGMASADSRVLVAYLDGGNELPALGDPDAFGVATVTLISPGAICYSIVLQNAVAATAAHIHSGAAGVAGAIVIPLPVNALVPIRIANCVAAAPATITAIRNAPENFYVNVHNAAFPGGAARGQLQPQ